jgi:pimeloyl-ACP methyl ester carboxylesterase
MHAAVARPDRFAAMVIVDPMGAVPDGGRAGMIRHFTSRLTAEEASAWLDLQKRMDDGEPAGPLADAQSAILWRYYFADPEGAPSTPPLASNPDAGQATQSSIEHHFANETLVRGLPQVSLPTLFLAGTCSPIPHVESQRSAALMPRAEMVTLPTGHFPWLESREPTVSAIASFLDRAGGGE